MVLSQFPKMNLFDCNKNVIISLRHKKPLTDTIEGIAGDSGEALRDDVDTRHRFDVNPL
jgi:hypothetical protein